MKSGKIVCFLAVTVLSFHVLGATVEKKDLLNHDKTENFISEHFRVNRFLATLQYLQGLGKDKAIARLEEYEGDGTLDIRRDDDVLLLCHNLFANPDGWPLIVLPQASEPEVNPNAIKSLSSFPLIYQGEATFLLIKGYHLGGRGLSVKVCIEQCKKLDMVKREFSVLPNSVVVKSGEDLVIRDILKNLYVDKSKIQDMGDFIAEQAK